jgi:transcriptional regulator with XRE-family HTH domain
MSPEQCRAARAWLNWSQTELATKAQVSNSTLRDFEAGRRVPIANNLLAIRRALEDAGMEFLYEQGNKPWGVATCSAPQREPTAKLPTR